MDQLEANLVRLSAWVTELTNSILYEDYLRALKVEPSWCSLGCYDHFDGRIPKFYFTLLSPDRCCCYCHCAGGRSHVRHRDGGRGQVLGQKRKRPTGHRGHGPKDQSCKCQPRSRCVRDFAFNGSFATAMCCATGTTHFTMVEVNTNACGRNKNLRCIF